MKRVWQWHYSFMLCMLFVLPSAVYGWGANGHRITGQIGYDHLTEKTRSRLNQILGPGDLILSRAATWPDEIRSDPRWDFAKSWHFFTVEDSEDVNEVIKKHAANDHVDNVYEAIFFFENVLKGDQKSIKVLQDSMKVHKVEPYLGSVEATAVAFLVHFVGDIHQPLHVGRGDDRGGNSIKVNWFDQVSNLHSVWDEGLIEQQDLSFTELVRFIDTPTSAGEKTWKSNIVAWQNAAPVVWAKESIDMRPQVYAYTKKDIKSDYPSTWKTPAEYQNILPYLSYGYTFKNWGAAKSRLLKGGVRLAGRLNAIFD